VSTEDPTAPKGRDIAVPSRALRTTGARIAKGTGKLLLRGGLAGVRTAWGALRREAREINTEMGTAWKHLRPDDSRTQAYALAGGAIGRKVGTLVEDVRAIGKRLHTSYRRRQHGLWP